MPRVNFEYRDFWEIPRLLVCMVDGVELLLDSEFDDSTNAYASAYKIYALPPELAPGSADSWADPELPKPTYLGSIPVNAIDFDPTRRETLEAEPLQALLKHGQTGPA